VGTITPFVLAFHDGRASRECVSRAQKSQRNQLAWVTESLLPPPLQIPARSGTLPPNTFQCFARSNVLCQELSPFGQTSPVRVSSLAPLFCLTHFRFVRSEPCFPQSHPSRGGFHHSTTMGLWHALFLASFCQCFREQFRSRELLTSFSFQPGGPHLPLFLLFSSPAESA